MTDILPPSSHEAQTQMEIKNIVTKITEMVENKNDVSTMLEELFHLSGHKSQETDFQNYWSWTSLEELCSFYYVKPAPRNIRLNEKQIVELFRLAKKQLLEEPVFRYYCDYLDWNTSYDTPCSLIFYPPEDLNQDDSDWDPSPEQLAAIVIKARPIAL